MTNAEGRALLVAGMIIGAIQRGHTHEHPDVWKLLGELDGEALKSYLTHKHPEFSYTAECEVVLALWEKTTGNQQPVSVSATR